ncbi:MAG: SPFH domain-containing protein [Acidobacteria bacterium]|nr:SPFH domain-containing protein [Acidobacteriota bacterium]
MQEIREFKCFKVNGFAVLVVHLLILVVGVLLLVLGVNGQVMPFWITAIPILALALFLGFGYFTVQPNQSRVLIFFGKYSGSTSDSGFWWTNPLVIKKTVSLRVRNFSSEKIKVNDATGNPIEIGVVVVWRVVDSARATFDVDDYEQFVDIQSETAIRSLATRYPYDLEDESGKSLKGSPDEIAGEMCTEVQERLQLAGVRVMEARLMHLAYAPEIAHAMLRRQQAHAVVAARRLIVEAAVGMVEHALDELSRKQVVNLDEEKKATMVNNLMVVLTSEQSATPVVNAGSLYS